MDLISTRRVDSLSQASEFESHVGGQAANVARNVALLGGRSAMVGRVGADGFGQRCVKALQLAGVDVSGVIADPQAPTTMAIVAQSATTPDFFIYRGADKFLTAADLPVERIASSRAVHASAFVLSHEPSRSAVLEVFARARAAEALVTLDPTYHPRVWGPEQDPLPVLAEAYRYVSVTKPSLDDCHRLFGPGGTPEEYAKRFLVMGPRLVVLTLGAGGALMASADGGVVRIPGRAVPVADVTGAGDAFWGGLLMGLLDGRPAEEAVRLGMAVAERKIQQAGPLHTPLDRHALLEEAGRLPR